MHVLTSYSAIISQIHTEFSVLNIHILMQLDRNPIKRLTCDIRLKKKRMFRSMTVEKNNIKTYSFVTY